MASLRVPDKYVSGLAKFFRLSDDQTERLFSALETSPVSRTPTKTLREAVRATEAPKADVEKISNAVMSLFAIWKHDRKPRAEVIDELTRAIEESDAEDLQFSVDVKQKIVYRLTRLFGTTKFVTSISADAERFEYDKIFADATVSTDIRPIFGIDDSPELAMFTHMLNIHYYEGGDHKEFYVALDETDIQSFVEVLQRASQRTDRLKPILSAAELGHFVPE